MTRTEAIITTGLIFIMLVLLSLVFGTMPEQPNRAERGLAELAIEMEDTGQTFGSGTEFIQAVYYSQGADIDSTWSEASYVELTSALPGDIVEGEGYVGIFVDDTTAIGVPHGGGPAQTMRITSENIYHVGN